jgi:hypothetical protein
VTFVDGCLGRIAHSPCSVARGRLSIRIESMDANAWQAPAFSPTCGESRLIFRTTVGRSTIALSHVKYATYLFLCQCHGQGVAVTKHRIYAMSFAKVYPAYIAKAERKGRTKAEVDQIILWLTAFSQAQLGAQLKKETDIETFFAKAPSPNPSRSLIKGVVCGVHVEEIQEPTMREIRYLDKLIDELAKGKPMEKILRMS